MFHHHLRSSTSQMSQKQPPTRPFVLGALVSIMVVVAGMSREGEGLIGFCSAAPNPSDRRQNNNNFFEVRGTNEVFESNHHHHIEENDAVVSDRSFGAMDTTATTTIAPASIIADHTSDANMECSQAKELSNVQSALEELYPDMNLESYYFCARSSPNDLYCYCGVASICHDYNDPWGRNIGECGCCTQWVYIMFAIFMTIVGLVFCCGMFACLCHGTWLYDGHPRPITPMLPQRTAPVIAPAAFPLPANAFRGYRSSDFISADEQQQNNNNSPTGTTTASNTRPQSPRVGGGGTTTRSSNNNTLSPREDPDDVELEPRGSPNAPAPSSAAAASSGRRRRNSSSAGGVAPHPPIPSGSATSNPSPTASDGNYTNNAAPTRGGGGGWVYDSDGNLLLDEDVDEGTARNGGGAAAMATSANHQATYSPSSQERHHHPVTPTRRTTSTHRETEGNFVNFEEDPTL